jgi:hypothetical protein
VETGDSKIVTPDPSGKPRSSAKRKAKKVLLISLAVIIAGLVLFVYICSLPYSEGTRSGVLVKVSRKGYLFKTYEGEMNIGGFDQGEGTIMPASVFKFSVTDKKVYEELEKMQGRKVVLHYKQVMKNFFWQGETDYFITEAAPYNAR